MFSKARQALTGEIDSLGTRMETAKEEAKR